MKDQSTFQMIILAGFVIVGLIGVAVFALSKATSQRNIPLTIWGTVSSDVVNEVRRNNTSLKGFDLTYVERNPETLYNTLLEAIASGQGPDLIFITSGNLYQFRDKLYQIPYETISAREFRNTYIEGAEIFMTDSGIYGLPIYVDPLVLYWNRNILQTVRIPSPPQYWDELPDLARTVTLVDGARNISRSVIPFGEYRNITHAKDILATLFLQSNVPIFEFEEEAQRLRVRLSESGGGYNSGESALLFYTDFSNPSRNTYTWSRSLPSSRQMFIAGDLLFYPGRARELFLLRQTNPNLNFDVTEIPQARDAVRPSVYGDITAVAVLRTSQNLQAAFNVAYYLSQPEAVSLFAENESLPPAHRDLLTAPPDNPAQTVFYRSALITESFPDPNPPASDNIFLDMIESITSGRNSVSQALRDAQSKLQTLLRSPL